MPLSDLIILGIVFLLGIIVGAAARPSLDVVYRRTFTPCGESSPPWLRRGRSGANGVVCSDESAPAGGSHPMCDGWPPVDGFAFDLARAQKRRFFDSRLTGKIERDHYLASRQQPAQPPNGSPKGVIRMKGDEPFISLRNRD